MGNFGGENVGKPYRHAIGKENLVSKLQSVHIPNYIFSVAVNNGDENFGRFAKFTNFITHKNFPMYSIM